MPTKIKLVSRYKQYSIFPGTLITNTTFISSRQATPQSPNSSARHNVINSWKTVPAACFASPIQVVKDYKPPGKPKQVHTNPEGHNREEFRKEIKGLREQMRKETEADADGIKRMKKMHKEGVQNMQKQIHGMQNDLKAVYKSSIR